MCSLELLSPWPLSHNYMGALTLRRGHQLGEACKATPWDAPTLPVWGGHTPRAGTAPPQGVVVL